METLENSWDLLGFLRWVGVHIWAGRTRAEHKGRTRAGELGVQETRTLHRFGGKQAVEGEGIELGVREDETFSRRQKARGSSLLAGFSQRLQRRTLLLATEAGPSVW